MSPFFGYSLLLGTFFFWKLWVHEEAGAISLHTAFFLNQGWALEMQTVCKCACKHACKHARKSKTSASHRSNNLWWKFVAEFVACSGALCWRAFVAPQSCLSTSTDMPTHLSGSSSASIKLMACVAIALQAWGAKKNHQAAQVSTCKLVATSKPTRQLHQEPKRTHKAKNHTNSTKEFSEQFEGATGSLPSKTRVSRQIAPESSTERPAKSLSHSFFVVPCLSPIVRPFCWWPAGRFLQ